MRPRKYRNQPDNGLTLVVPMPPSVNSLFRNVPGRGRAITSTYRAWIDEAGYQINRQTHAVFDGDVDLTITIGPRKPGADASNFIKAPEDLLVRHGVLKDDSHVVDVRCRWGDVKGCQIDISPHIDFREV